MRPIGGGAGAAAAALAVDDGAGAVAAEVGAEAATSGPASAVAADMVRNGAVHTRVLRNSVGAMMRISNSRRGDHHSEPSAIQQAEWCGIHSQGANAALAGRKQARRTTAERQVLIATWTMAASAVTLTALAFSVLARLATHVDRSTAKTLQRLRYYRLHGVGDIAKRDEQTRARTATVSQHPL